MIEISYSASTKYQQSPFAYYLHYIRRIRSAKVGSALLFGSAIDLALNAMLKNKMNKMELADKGYVNPRTLFTRTWLRQQINGQWKSLKNSDLITYSKSDYDENILTDEDKNLIEKNPEINPNWVSLYRKGHMIIDAYELQALPLFKEVIAVQKYIKLKNASGDSFIGWVDFIARIEDDRIIIFDNKTSSMVYKEDSARNSEQLATYFVGTKDIKVDGVGYVVIPKKFRKKKEPLIPIDIIIDNVNDAVIEKTFQDYDKTLYGIKMGLFPCSGCNDSPWGCVYKRFCESDGEDMTGLIEVPKGDYSE